MKLPKDSLVVFCLVFIGHQVSACENETEEASVVFGGSIQLECGDSSDVQSYNWVRVNDGQEVHNDTIFHISSASFEDSGNYICSAHEASCTGKYVFLLQVEYSIMPRQPEVHSYHLHKDSDVAFKCAATGNPVPKLYWVFIPASGTANQNETSQSITPTASTDPEVTTAHAHLSHVDEIVLTAKTLRYSNFSRTHLQSEHEGTYICRAFFHKSVQDAQVKIVHITIDHSGVANILNIILAVIVIPLFLTAVIVVTCMLIAVFTKNKRSINHDESEENLKEQSENQLHKIGSKSEITEVHKEDEKILTSGNGAGGTQKSKPQDKETVQETGEMETRKPGPHPAKDEDLKEAKLPEGMSFAVSLPPLETKKKNKDKKRHKEKRRHKDKEKGRPKDKDKDEEKEHSRDKEEDMKRLSGRHLDEMDSVREPGNEEENLNQESTRNSGRSGSRERQSTSRSGRSGSRERHSTSRSGRSGSRERESTSRSGRSGSKERESTSRSGRSGSEERDKISKSDSKEY